MRACSVVSSNTCHHARSAIDSAECVDVARQSAGGSTGGRAYFGAKEQAPSDRARHTAPLRSQREADHFGFASRAATPPVSTASLSPAKMDLLGAQSDEQRDEQCSHGQHDEVAARRTVAAQLRVACDPCADHAAGLRGRVGRIAAPVDRILLDARNRRPVRGVVLGHALAQEVLAGVGRALDDEGGGERAQHGRAESQRDLDPRQPLNGCLVLACERQPHGRRQGESRRPRPTRTASPRWSACSCTSPHPRTTTSRARR